MKNWSRILELALRKPLRFATVVGVVVLTSWLSTSSKAYALPECSSLDSQYCSPWEGDGRITCWSSDRQSISTCWCDGTATWFCKL